MSPLWIVTSVTNDVGSNIEICANPPASAEHRTVPNARAKAQVRLEGCDICKNKVASCRDEVKYPEAPQMTDRIHSSIVSLNTMSKPR